MSTTTENTTRPARAPAASVVLTVMAIVTGLLLAPVTSARAAEPLPTGTYEVAVAGGEILLEVDADGDVALTASDGLVVQLDRDDDGRVLDEFTVTTDVGTYVIEIELEDDGTYAWSVRQEPLTADGATSLGDIVSTVAQCAPTGLVAQALGLPNHGSIVSTAASGLTFQAEVTDPIRETVTVVTADFSTLEGAESFCDQVEAAVPTLDEVRESLDAVAQAARAERQTAQQERAAAQAAIARARAAERAADQAAQRAVERSALEGEGATGRSDDAGETRGGQAEDTGASGGAPSTDPSSGDDAPTSSDDGAGTSTGTTSTDDRSQTDDGAGEIPSTTEDTSTGEDSSTSDGTDDTSGTTGDDTTTTTDGSDGTTSDGTDTTTDTTTDGGDTATAPGKSGTRTEAPSGGGGGQANRP